MTNANEINAVTNVTNASLFNVPRARTRVHGRSKCRRLSRLSRVLSWGLSHAQPSGHERRGRASGKYTPRTPSEPTRNTGARTAEWTNRGRDLPASWIVPCISGAYRFHLGNHSGRIMGNVRLPKVAYRKVEAAIRVFVPARVPARARQTNFERQLCPDNREALHRD